MFRRIRKLFREASTFAEAKDKLRTALALLPEGVDFLEGINWTKPDVDELIEHDELRPASFGLVSLASMGQDEGITVPAELRDAVTEVARSMAWDDVLQEIHRAGRAPSGKAGIADADTAYANVERYRSVVRSGGDVGDVCAKLRDADADTLFSVRILRELFGLSLEEAHEALKKHDQGV